MGIAKGLKAMEAVIDKPRFGGDEDRPKVRWLQLADGQSVKARFINELDSDSAHYDPSRDLAIVVAEHTNPKDYKRKAVCTMDSEGRCFGCEMARSNPKTGWHSRLRFYTNLLIDDGTEPAYVAVWSQGVGKNSSFNTIREYVMDTGSVSNLTWRLKRQGTGMETTYVLLPTTPDSEPFNWSGVEPYNLEKVVRELPYAEQEDFYLGFENAGSSSSTTIEW